VLAWLGGHTSAGRDAVVVVVLVVLGLLPLALLLDDGAFRSRGG
jgi:hypothetical protein